MFLGLSILMLTMARWMAFYIHTTTVTIKVSTIRAALRHAEFFKHTVQVSAAAGLARRSMQLKSQLLHNLAIK